MDVRMPDGTVVTNVPDNITQEDLLERYQGYQPPAVGASNNQYDVEPGFFRGIGSLLTSGAESAIIANKISPTVIGGGDVGALAPDIFKELTADPYRPQALREVTSAFADIGEEGKKAKGVYGNVQSAGRVVAEVGKQLITNPQGVMYMTAEQAANMVPAIVGMMSGAAAGTAVAGPVGGVVGGIGGGFATQAPGEIGSEFIGNVGKELQARGMQVTPANIETLLNDKEFTARAISESRTKGATTAAVDAAFTLAAGKIAVAPRKAALAIAKKELGEQATAASQIARAQEILKARGFSRKIVTGGKSVGTEVVGGGASEAAGSLAAYGDVDWGDAGVEMLAGLGGSAFEVPAAARALREKVTGGTEAQAQEAQEAKQQDDLTRPMADLSSPVVSTMTTTANGKDSVKVTRADGSVDVDGVMVEPPRQAAPQAPEGDVAQNREEMMAEVEGRQLPLAEQPVQEQPAPEPPPQVQPPPVAPSQVQPPAGQLDLVPVNPEGTVLPAPTPPAAPVVAQLPLAPVNPEGTVIAPPKPVDPNVEAQLAAVEPDVEGMIPNEPPPPPKVKAIRTPKAPEAPRINYGVDADGNAGVSFEDGGLPFPNRAAAKKANKSGMKVVAVDGGFALADKTEKDIANDKVRAKNLKSGPKGFLSAHAYIASLGGLNKNEAAELDPDAAKSNIKVGNKYVYASKGGLSMGEAATALNQEGYIENEDNNEALRVLSESINEPVYSMRDADAIAEQQFEARNQQEADEFAQQEAGAAKEAQLVSQENSEYANYLAIELEFGDSTQSMLDAGYTQQDLNVVGFTKASPELKAEVAALEEQARALGLDVADVLESLQYSPKTTELEYYTRAKSELTKAIAAAAKQGSGGNVSQANVSAASEGIESPTEAGLKAKQDAIDKAAAEKAKSDRAADTKDKAEEQRKAIAAASEKAAGEFELGKSAEDDLSGQKPMFSRSTAEQKENAELVADNFNGKVVYQNGDLSLIQGRDEHNDVVYVSAKGTRFYASSIEKLKNTSALFTQKETKELLDARATLEAQEDAKHAAKPFVTFKNGMAMSKNVSPELEGIFKQWKSLLKLNQNIYLSTIEDALANKDDFAGPQRRIGNAAFTLTAQGIPGSTQALADGTRYILIDQSQSPAELIEILAHEMGHAHEQEMFNNAPVALQNQIKAEFDKWLDSQKGKTAKEFIYALRAKETAETTSIPNPDMLAKDLKKYDSYWSTFSEWYADQTARWATTSEKPLTAVDKFFAKVAETLRNFFKSIQGLGFLPNTTFKQYMDDITATEIVAANPVTSINEQMPLFATKNAQATLPGIANKPNKTSPNAIQKPKPAASWQSLEPMTWKDTRAIQLFDKHRNLDLVQKEITKIVGEIGGDLNAYRTETLAHGRSERQVKDFLSLELRPIIKEMKDGNITDDNLTEYLVMRHAEEANDLIAKRNPNDPSKQDKGSGISYQQRDKYFKALDPAKKQVFESLAKKVDGVLKKTRDLLEEGGVITKEERDAWESLFQFYVPLRREESDYSLPSSSYRRVGNYAKSRTGSSQDVIDVLSNIASAREIAVHRIEKERVHRAVYGLAVMNPNPEYWMAVSPDAIKNKDVLIAELEDNFDLSKQDAEAFVKSIMTEPTKERFNKATGVVDRYIDTTAKYADYVLPAKMNGKDRFVFFNPKNDRAMQMVQSLRGLDVPQLGSVMQTIAPITRFFSAINTQYNLIFGAWNFARDVQGARLNLSTTPIAEDKNAVFTGTFSAIPDIYKAVREQAADKPFSDTGDGSWDDFTTHGGKVGFKDQFARLNQSANIVNRELAKLDRGNIKSGAFWLADWISNANDVLENATRLSAYRVALDKFKKQAEANNPGGKISQKQLEDMKANAADIAKNITVNFNRKGTWGVTAGSLYAFFGASAQGTKRLYETLSGPKGKTIMAAGIGIGIAQAIALAAFGFDEDEPTEFIKQKNLIFPTGNGKYVMFPMPFGFNVFPNLGRIFFEAASKASKGQSVTPQLINTVTMLANAFNPLGGGGLFQMVAPTVADPIVAIIENKDAFGRPISRESRATSPVPGYKLSRDPSPSISQFLAEFINTITFGDKDKKGFLSPTADQIDYLAKQLGGGVYREASGILTYGSNKIQDKETPDYKVPIAGKIVGDLNSPPAISQRFYSNVIKMAEHEASIKGRIGRRENVAEYTRKNPEAFLWRRANTLENEITKINKRRREMVAKKESVERIKKIDDQKTRMMKQFNEQVRKAQ